MAARHKCNHLGLVEPLARKACDVLLERLRRLRYARLIWFGRIDTSAAKGNDGTSTCETSAVLQQHRFYSGRTNQVSIATVAAKANTTNTT